MEILLMFNYYKEKKKKYIGTIYKNVKMDKENIYSRKKNKK